MRNGLADGGMEGTLWALASRYIHQDCHAAFCHAKDAVSKEIALVSGSHDGSWKGGWPLMECRIWSWHHTWHLCLGWGYWSMDSYVKAPTN